MKVLLSIFLFVYFTMLPPSNCYAADWKYYSRDKSGNAYLYDEESIVRLPGDTAQVWTKCVFSEEYKEGLRKLRIEDNPRAVAEGFEKLKRNSYTIDLLEINCATRTIQGLMEKHYDDNGNLLDTLDKETLSKFAKHAGIGPYIQPGSINEDLYNVVCKKASTPKQKKGKSRLSQPAKE